MVAEDPQIAGLGDGRVGSGGDVIGIGMAVLRVGTHELRQLVGGKAGHIEVEFEPFQVEKLLNEKIFIPGGQLGGFVVGQAIGLDLRGR